MGVSVPVCGSTGKLDAGWDEEECEMTLWMRSLHKASASDTM